MTNDMIHKIEIKDIIISEQNVRMENATRDLDELADSIKENGLMQPVILCGDYGNPPYELISGQRRFLAHKEKLRVNKIRCIFAGKLTPEQKTLLSLVENLQRVELNHADAARAITDLYNKYEKDERRIQRETGLSMQCIRNYISIDAQASDIIKMKLKEKKVEIADVKRAIKAAQGNMKTAEELLDFMEQYPLNKHQKKRLVEHGQKDNKASAKTIFEEAMKPRVEQSIMVNLPKKIRQALELAVKSLSKGPEEIVSDILQDWLDFQGYLK